ncbi:MAG TPA: SusC/RagA family TonB-linked outer membrane protein [Ohtaekwangia sp.]
MKRILLVCLTAVFALASSELWAQERTVSGRVTSAEDGSGLPGVNIVLKGTTNGTVTDANGDYTLKVPAEGGTLVFTFIGLTSQESVIGASNSVSIAMAQDVQQLSEVVVTALGTKQNAREVTYANQTVKSSDLMSTPQKNALEALRGKTAGVQITTGSGSVGASTRIVLRGEASLTGNNNALIVVDGVPINNTSSIGGAQSNESGYADFGNRFNDLDPNNIESVTILKGPSATSLYGSRGASGVVVVTTKSGQKGKIKVDINSTASVEQAYVLNKRQNQFSQGILNPDGSTNRDSGENFSWGPAFDGFVRPWTSPVDADGDGDLEWLSRPDSPVKDQLQNFFRSGYTLNNSLSLSGGDDRFTYFTSFANTKQNGVLENTDYERNNLIVNTTAKLNDKVSAGINVSYSFVEQNTAQEGGRAFEGQNPYASALQAPANIDYTQLKDYKNPFHSFDGYYGTYAINPYFILNEYVNNAKTNNVLTTFNLSYTPIKDLTLATRFGVNFVSMDRKTTVPSYQYNDHYIWEDNLTLVERTGRQGSTGSHSERLDDQRNIDWTTTASYRKNLSERLSLTTTAGLNYFDIERKTLDGSTNGGFVVPGVYNLANSKERASVTQIHQQRRIIGLFGEANFGFDDKLFIQATARNDWSSTLPVDAQSFFYWSLGGSAILSDYLGFDSSTPIEFMKVRASYGTSGKDADIFQLASLYVVNPTVVDFDGADESTFQLNTPLNGQTAISRSPLIGNNTLEPELTKTIELGADFTFLNGRIEFNYTYYKSNSSKQIFLAELPRSSGYSQTAINFGEMENRGHEIQLTGVPVMLDNGFKWTVNLAWSKNINEVLKVSADVDDFVIFDTGRDVTLRAEVGQPFGVWKGNAQRFTEDGNPIVDANGNRAFSSDISTLGNVQPDWRGSVINTFTYKGIRLSALIDIKHGGDIFSTTKFYTEFNGTAETTTLNDRVPYLIPNSVVENLDAEGNGLGTFTPNTKPVDVFSYFNDANGSTHILDGSYVKLREVSLGYTLPKSICNKIKVSGINVNFFAKNLKFWLSDENTFGDPEVNGPTGPTNAQGVESSQVPTQKSYGVNLNITL